MTDKGPQCRWSILHCQNCLEENQYAFRDAHGTYCTWWRILTDVLFEATFPRMDWLIGKKFDVIYQTTSPGADWEFLEKCSYLTDSNYPSASPSFATDGQPSLTEHSTNSLSKREVPTAPRRMHFHPHASFSTTFAVVKIVLSILYMSFFLRKNIAHMINRGDRVQ